MGVFRFPISAIERFCFFTTLFHNFLFRRVGGTLHTDSSSATAWSFTISTTTTFNSALHTTPPTIVLRHRGSTSVMTQQRPFLHHQQIALFHYTIRWVATDSQDRHTDRAAINIDRHILLQQPFPHHYLFG